MADSQKLITWLLNHSDELKLRVTELTWVRDWKLAGVFDFQVSITLHGRTFSGRGTATSEELAFVKAGAEAIERAFCGGLGISSLGVAVHTNAALARQNATQELFERDAFFCHYYSKIPFLDLESDRVRDFEQKWPAVFQQLRSRKVDCRFFKAGSNIDPVIVCIFSGLDAARKFGGCIGLGSHSLEIEAMQSAFFEGLRNAAVSFLVEDLNSISESDFLKIEKPSSFDRQRLAKNIEYWTSFEHLFDGPKLPVRQSKISTAQLSTERLMSPYQEIEDAPVFVCRATFEQSCGELLRPQDKSPTTMMRLQEFVGQNLTDVELETRPHFLG